MGAKILKGLFWFLLVLGALPLIQLANGGLVIDSGMLFLSVAIIMPILLSITIIFMKDENFEYSAVVKYATCAAIATKYTDYVKEKYPDAYDTAYTAVYNAIYQIKENSKYNAFLFNTRNNCNCTEIIMTVICGFFASFWFCIGHYANHNCYTAIFLDIIVGYALSGIWITIWILFLVIEKYHRKKEKDIDVFFQYYNDAAGLICPMRDKSMAQHLSDYRNHYEKPHSRYKWEVKHNDTVGTYDVVGKPITEK
jgi:hypothetical protein